MQQRVTRTADAPKIVRIVGTPFATRYDVVDLQKTGISAARCLALVVGPGENFSSYSGRDGAVIRFGGFVNFRIAG